MLPAGQGVAKRALQRPFAQAHASGRFVGVLCRLRARPRAVMHGETDRCDMRALDRTAVCDELLDRSPALEDERARGAIFGFGQAVTLLERLAVDEAAGAAGLAVRDRRELVEHAPADAEKKAGMRDRRHTGHA